jgi:integrase
MEAILAMIASLDLQMAREPEGSVKVAAIERRRWILALLFGLWGRRSEIARLKMSDFVMDSASRWSVTLKRKGGRLDTIPLADWVVHALMRYRQSLGVSALPHATDDSGAIGLLRKRQSPGRADMPPGNQLIYREVLQAAREAACALRAGEVLPEMDAIQREAVASRLDELSPHWFRHSGASLAINTGALSLMNASKLLGHSSADITFRMYHHSNDSQITDGVQQLGGGAFV